MTEYRSVSQLKEYRQCGYRYYLSRLAKDKDGNRIWQRPAAWFPQGLAFHEAAEWWENSHRTGTLEEAQAVYTESYDKHTNRLTAETPNLEAWFDSSWRYPPEKDIERRYLIGLEQVEKYLKYCLEKKPKEVLFENKEGNPFVEQPFEFELDGVKVRGYIDAVYWDDERNCWAVRDYKTGKSPGEATQLAVYGYAVNQEYDLDITHGDYWMAKTGKPTVRYDIREWTEQQLTDIFGLLDEDIRSERFDPKPSPDNCKFCSVAAACEYAAIS